MKKIDVLKQHGWETKTPELGQRVIFWNGSFELFDFEEGIFGYGPNGALGFFDYNGIMHCGTYWKPARAGEPQEIVFKSREEAMMAEINRLYSKMKGRNSNEA